MTKMRKYLILLSALTLIGSVALASGVQKTKWGMTQEQVRKLHKGLKSSSPTDLTHHTTFASKPAYVGYSFLNGAKLTSILVIFKERYLNPNNYINQYFELQRLLTQKYGEPGGEEVNWSDNTFRQSSDHYGTALVMGHLELLTTWTVGGTSIMLVCKGEAFEAHVAIRYSSTADIEAMVKNEESQQLNDL